MIDAENDMVITGAVVIGRNEGERLKSCLNSVLGEVNYVVYVDSGSTDGSVEYAASLGISIISLDISIPFTAARARNEGFFYLLNEHPELTFVQFIDGDCEVVDQWLTMAKNFLISHDDVAVVCGRRRERYPERSIYNLLCDIEWNTPVGQTLACGGDALIRVKTLKAVGGYNASVIAGEEPELCVRIRQQDMKVWRLDADMTLHDANMTHFKEWWQRNVRSGFAFALGAAMHGAAPERHWVRESRRGRLWGLYLPSLIIIASIIQPEMLMLSGIYLLQITRIAISLRSKIKTNWLYAIFITLAKFPEAQGQIRFLLNRLMRKQNTIIEYKS